MNHSLDKLLSAQCQTISGNESPINLSEIETLRKLTPHWQYCATENEISQTFRFETYLETISFVNEVANIAEAQNHHPDMEVGFQRCKVCFSTHSVNGVTLNDFICAAKIDALD